VTRIRSISADELPAFASASGAAHAADQLAYLTSLIDQGASHIEWCFLAQTDSGATGRVALWTLPKVGRPLSIILLEATHDGVAADLLRHAAQMVREAGGKTLDTVLDDPPQSPQWQSDPERRQRWLTNSGFQLLRATSRWTRSASDPVPELSTRLSFSPISKTGEGAFLSAMERVGTAAKDRYAMAERQRIGAATATRVLFDKLREMEWKPDWWELAIDNAGDLVGLIMPTLGPTMGTIGYIGVVPEHRGRGYVNDLLARGTATLMRCNAPVLRADTDLENVPMAAAFARGGWHALGTRREFETAV
jgi:hypothetical protein